MKLLLFTTFCCVCIFGYTQTKTSSKPVELLNTERLKLDFDILDYEQSLENDQLLNSINLSTLENVRMDGTDTTINLANFPYTIIVFSREKTLVNKTNHFFPEGHEGN